MQSIKVLVAEMPELLSQILKRLIDDQRDMEIASASVQEPKLVKEVDSLKPHVLILSSEATDVRDKAKSILKRFPTLSVIALTGNGHEGTLYQLRPYEKHIRPLSSENLIETIRKVAQ